MEEIIKDKKVLIIVALIVMCMILFIVEPIFEKNNENKYFKNKNYVFTIQTEGNSKLPHINLESEEIEKINKQLEEKYYEIVSSKSNSFLTYEYSINNHFLSLLVTEKIDKDSNDIPDMMYYAYYIDVDDMKVYTKEEIFHKFNLDSAKVEEELLQSLQEQYDYESKEGYVVYQECDFACYLELRKYENMNNNFQLYVKNNKVYGYLNLTNKVYYYTREIHPTYKYLYEL